MLKVETLLIRSINHPNDEPLFDGKDVPDGIDELSE